jgi:hypothetical protein
MLQLFKQQDSRNIAKRCRNTVRVWRTSGEEVDLPGWGELLETSRMAIAFSQNSYRLLASLIIKEIKQAQELVTGKSLS